ETQVIAFVLSADSNNDPDVLGINAASAALTLSDIPFLGPIGAVRVGLVNGQFLVNPTYDELRDKVGNPTRKVRPPQFDEAYYNDLNKKVGTDLADALDTKKHPKAESY